MIATVSTVRDSPDNVQRFVAGNLAAGVDHMFIFLDGEQPEVSERLAGLACVTTTVTDAAYWVGGRPGGLNTRQTINANVVRVLLAPFEWAQWLFHIDGDECLDIDRERLLALDSGVRSVRLSTLEAVSTPGGTAQGRFKRLLDPDELSLLHQLGVIGRPENWALFNGHTHGKAGIRPSLDYNLHIHAARTQDQELIESFEADYLRILHYDSASLEEFIRKWGAHVSAGKSTVFGMKRSGIRAAVAAVLTNQTLTEARRQHYLRELYARTAQDDVDTLGELGFLVTPPPEWHRHVPAPLPADRARSVERLLDLLRAADKGYFRPKTPEQPADLLKSFNRRLLLTDRHLARAIGACVAASRRS